MLVGCALMKLPAGFVLTKPLLSELKAFAGGVDHDPDAGDGPGVGATAGGDERYEEDGQHDEAVAHWAMPKGPAALGHAGDADV